MLASGNVRWQTMNLVKRWDRMTVRRTLEEPMAGFVLVAIRNRVADCVRDLVLLSGF